MDADLLTPDPARPSAEIDAPIAIAVDGPDASVPLAHAHLLTDWLSAPSSRREAGPPEPGTTPCGFGWVRCGRLVFPAKLAIEAAAELHDRGHRVRLPKLVGRAADRWDAAPPAVRKLICDPRFAGFGGLVPSIAGADAAHLAYHLLRLFPRVRAAVATPAGAVRAWRRFLSDPRVGRAVVASPSDMRLWRGRRAVLVIPATELDCCQPDDFDLVLAPDARALARRPLIEEAPGRGWRRTFPVLREWRVVTFGFLPGAVEDLSRRERLILGSRFGPALPVGAPVVEPPPTAWAPLLPPPPWPG